MASPAFARASPALRFVDAEAGADVAALEASYRAVKTGERRLARLTCVTAGGQGPSLGPSRRWPSRGSPGGDGSAFASASRVSDAAGTPAEVRRAARGGAVRQGTDTPARGTM